MRVRGRHRTLSKLAHWNNVVWIFCITALLARMWKIRRKNKVRVIGDSNGAHTRPPGNEMFPYFWLHEIANKHNFIFKIAFFEKQKKIIMSISFFLRHCNFFFFDFKTCNIYLKSFLTLDIFGSMNFSALHLRTPLIILWNTSFYIIRFIWNAKYAQQRG